MTMTSRYADTPLAVQTARCRLALFIFQRSLRWFTPQVFEGDAGAQRQLSRVQHWLDDVLTQVLSHRLSAAGKLGADRAVKKYAALEVMDGLSAEAKSKRKVALLWGPLLLVDDCRICCPALARTRAWYHLARTADTLARSLLAVFPGTDMDGDEYYLQLTWWK